MQYLNRHWVQRACDDGEKVYQIYRLALVVWRDALFLPLRDQLFQSVMTMITRERDGETVNTQLIRSVTDSFVSLGVEEENENEASTHNSPLAVYKKCFEEDFLSTTEEYYIKESATFLEQNPVTEYLKKAISRFDEESRRVQTYLHESTRDELALRCEKVSDGFDR